jgi:hypothetical protein
MNHCWVGFTMESEWIIVWLDSIMESEW